MAGPPCTRRVPSPAPLTAGSTSDGAVEAKRAPGGTAPGWSGGSMARWPRNRRIRGWNPAPYGRSEEPVRRPWRSDAPQVLNDRLRPW